MSVAEIHERLAAIEAKRAAMDPADRAKLEAEERFEQRVSFVYAQQDWDSPHKQTKDQIREHMVAIYGFPALGR